MILLIQLIQGNIHNGSGELYEKFRSRVNLSFDAVSLIDADFTGKGKRGRSRVVELQYKPYETRIRL